MTDPSPDLKKARRRELPRSDSLENRLPPHSPEAEQGVLGCLLLAPKESVALCMEKFPEVEGMFYDLRNQTIYEAILGLDQAMIPVDNVSLHQRLKDNGTLEAVGGIPYLVQLLDIPSAANLAYYLELLEEKLTLRKLLALCSNLTSQVYERGRDVAQFLDESERAMLAIRPMRRQTHGIKSLVQEAINAMEYRCQHPDQISGFSTSIPDLDKLTDGCHQGEMIVVAGMTSTGKTALAVNIATHNAMKEIPVAIFTAEMLPVKIAIRMICAEAEANFKRLQENNIPGLILASSRIANAPIHVEAANNMSIRQMTAIARRLKQKHDIKMIVVDYLQLLTAHGDNREQQISAISKGIRSLALELNCAVLALSQLTDEGKLRESRSIGHDADSVWKLTNDGEWQPQIQPIKLTVEKCRDGETGEVPMTFFKHHTKFKAATKFPYDI